MNILGPSKLTPEAAAAWAVSRGATDLFASLASLYWAYAPERGVRPEVAYAQSAKETGFGNFGGVITPQYRNPCGLKTTDGGENSDPDAHQKFPTWEVGVIAHLDHLALYAGAIGYPLGGTPDPRHFPSLFGKAPTVEELSGNWAGEGYGESLRDSYVKPLLAFAWVPPAEPQYVTYDEFKDALAVVAEDRVLADADLQKALDEFRLTVKEAAERLLS